MFERDADNRNGNGRNYLTIRMRCTVVAKPSRQPPVVQQERYGVRVWKVRQLWG